MAKSRVAPQATIPRLELSAAVIGVRIYEKIIDELSLSQITAYFWTDSMCVLRYIQNTRSAFKIFVANRLEIIHDITDGDRWFYVPTKLNPADAASRGIMPNETDKINAFLKGPDFFNNDTYPTLRSQHNLNLKKKLTRLNQRMFWLEPFRKNRKVCYNVWVSATRAMKS